MNDDFSLYNNRLHIIKRNIQRAMKNCQNIKNEIPKIKEELKDELKTLIEISIKDLKKLHKNFECKI